MKHIYNLIINHLEKKELQYKIFNQVINFPKTIDLRTKFPEPYNQLTLGSCSANALCGLIQYNDLKFQGSRLFLYYNERQLENDIPDDAGSTMTNGINCLLKYGICPESMWPYDISQFKTKPSELCYTTALQHKAIVVHHIMQTEIEMKSALVNNQPFVVGIAIYSSFESEQVTLTGIIPMPNINNEQYLGGHAVVCVGYDDIKKVWIMRNSWGNMWGDNGYFYLPYEYLLDINLASDLWCINKMES